MAYAKKYYDPKKAHEYYEQHNDKEYDYNITEIDFDALKSFRQRRCLFFIR